MYTLLLTVATASDLAQLAVQLAVKTGSSEHRSFRPAGSPANFSRYLCNITDNSTFLFNSMWNTFHLLITWNLTISSWKKGKHSHFDDARVAREGWPLNPSIQKPNMSPES